jgi:hypothetical protein
MAHNHRVNAAGTEDLKLHGAGGDEVLDASEISEGVAQEARE